MTDKFSLTTSDGLQLNGASFSPPAEMKAAIVLIHGMGEHFGRYKHVIDFFMSKGMQLLVWTIVGMELRKASRDIYLLIIS
ncbi:MAG: alpha/beta hydrolase [Chitinophagaceae bacterium]|nr:alpha/beta hydrolase [Chitinophagaceae bacterium]